MAEEKKFNPLDPAQTAHPDSFAAKLAARKARQRGEATSTLDISELPEEERAQLMRQNAIKEAEKEFKFAAPETAKEKLVIVFDDSSSMEYLKIGDAREGTTEYMRECVPNEVAVNIVPLNGVATGYSCNLPALAVRVKSIQATGSTPLYERTQENMKPVGEIEKPTRMILFSDGEPNGGMTRPYNAETREYGELTFNTKHLETIKQANELRIPLDTVLIADANYSKESNEYRIMKDLADKTGGIFLVFEKGKVNMRQGLKYLTPGKRLLLMDSSFKAALEEGRV